MEDDRHAMRSAVRDRLIAGEQDHDPVLRRMLDGDAGKPGFELAGNRGRFRDAGLL